MFERNEVGRGRRAGWIELSSRVAGSKSGISKGYAPKAVASASPAGPPPTITT